MKRSLDVLVVFLVVVSCTLAQTSVTKGSFVGVGSSAFKSGYGEGFLSRIHTGLFVRVDVVSGLGIRPEISYSQRGEASSSASTILEYVDAALLADYKMTISESWGLRIHAMAGPMWSRMFQARQERHEGLTTFAQDIYGATSVNDAGWLFGSGISVDIGNGSVFADIRLFLGTHDLTIPGFGYPMLNRSMNTVVGFEF